MIATPLENEVRMTGTLSGKTECRVSLLALIVRHEAVPFGCIFFGLAVGIGMALCLPIDPWGEWRLSGGTAAASGRLERVEYQYIKMKFGWVPNGVVRYTYSFVTPAGSTVVGESYSEGQAFAQGARFGGEIPKERRPTVTVEYDHRDPRISRVRGARTAPNPTLPKVLFFLPMPLIGLAFIAAGVRGALVCAREVRKGSVAVTSREYHFDRLEVQTLEEFCKVCVRWPGPWARAAFELFCLLGLPAIFIAIGRAMSRWGPPV